MKANELVAEATWTHNSPFLAVSARVVAADPILHHTVVVEVHEVVWQLPLETYEDGVWSAASKLRPLIVT